MTNLRKEPAYRTCMVRMPGCSQPEGDCVLAHAHTPKGIRGGGQKAPDLLGAWACSYCHREYDRETHHFPKEQATFWFYEGVLRTQDQLIKEGKVHW